MRVSKSRARVAAAALLLSVWAVPGMAQDYDGPPFYDGDPPPPEPEPEATAEPEADADGLGDPVWGDIDGDGELEAIFAFEDPLGFVIAIDEDGDGDTDILILA